MRLTLTNLMTLLAFLLAAPAEGQTLEELFKDVPTAIELEQQEGVPHCTYADCSAETPELDEHQDCEEPKCAPPNVRPNAPPANEDNEYKTDLG